MTSDEKLEQIKKYAEGRIVQLDPIARQWGTGSEAIAELSAVLDLAYGDAIAEPMFKAQEADK